MSGISIALIDSMIWVVSAQTSSRLIFGGIWRDIVPKEHIDDEVRRLRIAESRETSHSRGYQKLVGAGRRNEHAVIYG